MSRRGTNFLSPFINLARFARSADIKLTKELAWTLEPVLEGNVAHKKCGAAARMLSARATRTTAQIEGCMVQLYTKSVFSRKTEVGFWCFPR